jgi:hypothetical protein
MDKVRDWLIVGTLLIYLGVSSLISGPRDNRLTTLVAPYIMLPFGIILLIRGIFSMAVANSKSVFKKLALAVCYPAMTMGVMFIAFEWLGLGIRERDIRLLLSAWPYLAVGAGLILIGIILRKASE